MRLSRIQYRDYRRHAFHLLLNKLTGDDLRLPLHVPLEPPVSPVMPLKLVAKAFPKIVQETHHERYRASLQC